MARFVVDLGPVKLSDEQEKAISAAIQAAVLSHIAQLPAPLSLGVGYIPIRWRGIIYRPTIEQAVEDARPIQEFSAGAR